MLAGKRIISYLVTLLCCFLFIGSIQPQILSKTSGNLKTKQSPSVKVFSPLKTWVGDYTFSEFAPPDENRFFSIIIYNKNNNYLAKIYIDGFQTLERDLAKVVGDEKSIRLEFLKYLPDNIFESYNKGDILISFERKSSKLITKWGKIGPLLLKNRKPGEYFKLDKTK